MQLCIPKSLDTSKGAEVFIKDTLIRSTKSTVSVVAVCNKMQSEPVFVADNWRWYIHSRQPELWKTTTRTFKKPFSSKHFY